MIYLVNYTNEDLGYTFGGISHTVKSGETKKVQEPEGNHALNALGSRGLSRIQFDDDGNKVNEDKNKEDAIERNKEFKVKQVVTYNERNAVRKASGQAYDMPTATVKRYASELGINLLQGYDLATGEKAVIADLHKKNEEKDKLIAELLKNQQTMMEQFEALKTQVSKGFVKPTEIVNKKGMVTCDICGEEVQAFRLTSHMINKHKGNKNGTESLSTA